MFAASMRLLMTVVLCALSAAANAQQSCGDASFALNEIVSIPSQPSPNQNFLVEIRGNRTLGSPQLLVGMTVSVSGDTITVDAQLRDQQGTFIAFCYTTVVGPLPAGPYTLNFIERSVDGAGNVGPPVLVATNSIHVTDPAVPTLGLWGLVAMMLAVLSIGLGSGSKKLNRVGLGKKLFASLSLAATLTLTTTIWSTYAQADQQIMR